VQLELVARETLRFTGLTGAVHPSSESSGRLKHEWGLSPLRVRQIERVRLHANLTILSQLPVALNRSQEAAPAA
jgi:hypothetical protein